MSNMHRILWLDEQIRAKRYPNTKDLAERFEISVRQAGRDMEYMQNSLRAPMTYNARRRGYEYADGTYILPSIFLTETDIRILNFLIYKYEEAAESMGYVEGLDRVVQTLKRFVPYQPEESDIPMFYVDTDMANRMHSIDQAIKQSQKLRITYRDGEEAYTVVVHPYRTYSQANQVYVIAFCEQSGEVEYYRLEQLTHIACTGEGYGKI
ncbi:helix-turn-helix transcriptional regulator [Paenibacillus mendelii]|uniref:Helix-turn-helix transcriptional regulator n=1 Tax=Paenibacillus mendelii TaxID=206163 RepID=A0ABV6J492_9BACL|nr:WYL domain-containing protein [Paenibacillus mendelii]MCQ6561777.1 WYL domain-containing protein [Paenibacillus mendelii]